MTQFIKNANAYLNLDSAATAEVKHGRNGASALTVRDVAGRELATVAAAQELNLEHLTAKLLAANATVICISSAGNVTAAVIVRYRICRTGVEPIYLVEPPKDSTRFMLAGASGLVRLDTGEIFTSVEAAKASLGMQPDQAEAEVVEMPKPAIGGRRRG